MLRNAVGVKSVVFTFGHDCQSFKGLAVINLAITGLTHYQNLRVANL
jgi:hypothetical protein